ncbi:VOC family protein [Robiginitalea sp. M366]|uniref:VOC family protein n=1 Tax=Robiginitalea aestuariiviva TaxID=3036903 RepID=UPI00240E679A|nr:VOC family protein [Robiginitalea aestuariiviva]MDG1570833.1 VOC family protein [Robiginitalea aestuariiviva]
MKNPTESLAYRAPDGTRIGHVHLKVSDLERALKFYRDLLGFRVTDRIEGQAVFLASGNYHHHIALNTWYSKGAEPAPRRSAGLFHLAICYPNRADLAAIYRRLLQAGYPLSGAADHGVSEALYLDDPDGNGVELYWDRPRDQWPTDPQGGLKMYTRPLDSEGLLELG